MTNVHRVSLWFRVEFLVLLVARSNSDPPLSLSDRILKHTVCAHTPLRSARSVRTRKSPTLNTVERSSLRTKLFVNAVALAFVTMTFHRNSLPHNAIAS